MLKLVSLSPLSGSTEASAAFCTPGSAAAFSSTWSYNARSLGGVS